MWVSAAEAGRGRAALGPSLSPQPQGGMGGTRLLRQGARPWSPRPLYPSPSVPHLCSAPLPPRVPGAGQREGRRPADMPVHTHVQRGTDATQVPAPAPPSGSMRSLRGPSRQVLSTQGPTLWGGRGRSPSPGVLGSPPATRKPVTQLCPAPLPGKLGLWQPPARRPCPAATSHPSPSSRCGRKQPLKGLPLTPQLAQLFCLP